MSRSPSNPKPPSRSCTGFNQMGTPCKLRFVSRDPDQSHCRLHSEQALGIFRLKCTNYTECWEVKEIHGRDAFDYEVAQRQLRMGLCEKCSPRTAPAIDTEFLADLEGLVAHHGSGIDAVKESILAVLG